MNIKQRWWGNGMKLGVLLLSVTIGSAATLPLPLRDLPSADAAGVSNNAASFQPVYASTNSSDSKSFRGVFTPASSSTKLAIHTDDGSNVRVDGVTVLSRLGVDTHFTNVSSSLFYIDYTFTSNVEYCVEVDYSNAAHGTNDIDGVTLYSYSGGGSARDGILVRGSNTICLNLTLALTADCADSPFFWSSSNTNVATVSSGTVTGVGIGTATITVTNSAGKSGTKAVTVANPGITPKTFLTCIGVTNMFVLTNSFTGFSVTWNPSGVLSADSRTNQVAFTNSGSNIVLTAVNAGCTATATGIVVAVASLTANVTNLCQSGQVIYTATTTPPGYESLLAWSGEGLSGSGAKRTNNYSSIGVKVVSVTCGTSVKQFTNNVYRIEITPGTQSVLADAASPAILTLTNSFGLASWQIAPSGGASFTGGSTGNTVSINPGSVGTNYVVTAFATALPSCSATATLQVVRVAFSATSLALCQGNSAPLMLTVTPSSALSLLTFDAVTNIASGIANTSASISPSSGSTNLTVTGVVAGTSTVRVRLGSSVFFGPAIKTTRVTFPTNDWYVGVGKASSYSLDLFPADAPVSYSSGNSSIATVSGSGTNFTITGVAPGTVQILAQVGGQTCAAKNVTVVRVTMDTNEIYLCIGQTATITTTNDPPTAPVTYVVANPAYASLGVSGNVLTITALTNAYTFVRAVIGTNILNSLAVRGLRVDFQTNAFFVNQSGTAILRATVSPSVYASKVTFSSLDTNIARVISSSLTPPFITVAGITNGGTQIIAKIGTNQLCASMPVTVALVGLEEVRFLGTNFYSIFQDNGAGLYPTNLHWTKTTRYPVAYRRNTYPAVATKFSILPATLTNAIAIRGQCVYGLPSTTNVPSGGFVLSTPAYTLSALPNQVDFINPLVIDWYISFDGGTTYLPAGSSTNSVYVTLDAPITNTFHTVMHLACKNGHATDSNAAVTNTWALFTGRNITTWDGRLLYYYKTNISFSGTCRSTADLLSSTNGNGQCGSWAHLLEDAFAANGIVSDHVTVLPTVDANFIVKDWTFGTASYPTAIHKWKLVLPTTAYDMVPLPTGGVYGELTSLAGLPGQNSPSTAEKLFGAHFIVKYNSLYYDPSYGVTYTDANDFESKAVEGYAEDVGDSTSTHRILRVKASTGLHEISLTP